jgi:hypothetical protein
VKNAVKRLIRKIKRIQTQVKANIVRGGIDEAATRLINEASDENS